MPSTTRSPSSELADPMHVSIRRVSGRRLRYLAPAATLSVVTAALAGCGGNPEGALAGQTATEVVSKAITAFHRERSFHFVDKIVAGSVSELQIGDVSATAANESITQGKTAVIQVALVNGTLYLRASPTVLSGDFGLSATEAAAQGGQWISISPSESAYSSVASSVSATSAIELFVPEEPNLKISGATTVDGRRVVAVQGTSISAPASGAVGKVTLFVSTTAPYLPVSATLVTEDASGKVVQEQAVLFGKWGEQVHLRPPSGVVPLSSLTS
jgi:hypothetical protein